MWSESLRRLATFHSEKSRKSLEGWEGRNRMTLPYHARLLKRIIGLLLIFAAIAVLAWNEKKAVENSRRFHDGLRSVVLLSTPNEVLEENEGKLVHVTGFLHVPESLEDPSYGVFIPAVKLKRRVQIYQWVEEKIPEENEHPGPHFQYLKMWKDKLVDSSRFLIPNEFENPKTLGVTSEIRINDVVKLGGFTLGRELKNKFNTFTHFTSGERPESPDIKMHMGLYYHSNDIWNPSVGDLRIQFSFAGPSDSFVSVVAKQVGHQLLPFYTDSGGELGFVHEGKKNHVEILSKEHSSLIFKTWISRGGTWLMLFLGTLFTAKPLFTSQRLNLMMDGGTKLSSLIATFVSLSTIGSIWFPHKPLFSTLLVVFACSLFLYNTSPQNEKKALPRYSKIY